MGYYAFMFTVNSLFLVEKKEQVSGLTSVVVSGRLDFVSASLIRGYQDHNSTTFRDAEYSFRSMMYALWMHARPPREHLLLSDAQARKTVQTKSIMNAVATGA